MYPASLYSKGRRFPVGCGFDFAVDVLKISMMLGQEIK